MPKLVPVDFNPFEKATKVKLTPVDFNPFGMKDAESKPSHAPVVMDMSDMANPRGPGKTEKVLRQSARIISPVARPVLEGAGTVVGSIAGGGAGIPSGPGAIATAAAGGGLGYGIGKQAADALDMYAGLKGPYKGPTAALIEGGKDVATGTALEGAGMALGAVLPVIGKAGKSIYSSVTSPARRMFSKSAMEKKAGEILLDNTSEGAIYLKNADEAAQLEEATGAKFTLGQRTNDPTIIALERALTNKPGSGAAAKLQERIAANNEAIRSNIDRSFPGEETVDDLIKEVSTQKARLGQDAASTAAVARNKAYGTGPAIPQASGEEAVSAIGAAKRPVKDALSQLEADIPDYPMTFGNVRKAISDARANKKLSDDQVQAIFKTENKIERILDDRGKTTFTAMGIRRTLNDEISKAFAPGGNKSVGEALTSVRDALEKDLSELSDMARSGKIGEYQGKPVNTDVIADELEKATISSARLKATQEPDIEGMVKAIKDKNGFTMMRQYGENETSFTARLSKDYKRIFGKDPLTKNTGTGAAGETDKRIAELKEVLKVIEPGKDVASAMKAFNDFARSEYFGRFDKGAVKRALAKGNEASGVATRAEDIPKLFTTPTGADDLIRAVGQEKASGIMKGHYAYDMLQNATNSNGEVVLVKLKSWLRRNGTTLNKYGIAEDFGKIHKAQRIADEAAKSAADFEKSIAAKLLKTDPEKAIGNALSGLNTGQAASELMKAVKGNPAATKGLQKAFADHVWNIAETTAKDIAEKPTISSAAFSKAAKKYMPAMRVLYANEPRKLAALKNAQRVYEVASRISRGPVSGSDTASKGLTSLAVDRAITAISPAASLVKGALKVFSKHSDKEVESLLVRALFDPEYAEVIMKAARGNMPEKELSGLINGKIVSLNDYRKKQLGRVAAGAAAGSNLYQEE